MLFELGSQGDDRSTEAEPPPIVSTMNDVKKRDFVAQMISLVEAEQEVLTEKGFDPADSSGEQPLMLNHH